MIYFITEFVPKYLPFLLSGALVTLELTFCSMLLGIFIGVVSAIGAFVLMGLTVDPMVGALGARPVGLFFMQAGFGAFAWMIATHAVYGIVLGNVYGRMVERDKRLGSMPGAAPAH